MDDPMKKRGGKTNQEKSPDLPVLGDQRRLDIAKVVLRSLCIAITITDLVELIIIEVAAPFLQFWPTAAYPLLGTFILWDISEFVTMMLRGSVSKGFHPGVHVAAELILWLGSLASTTIQALGASWSTFFKSEESLSESGLSITVRLAITQFGFLGLLVVLRFILFVMACVQTDRRNKDRRVRQLVLAIQKQGWNTQGIPLTTLKAARKIRKGAHPAVLEALEPSKLPRDDTIASPSPSFPSAVQQVQPPEDERDFAYKYNFPLATVPELLEAGIHPEDARNQKFLIGTFPRATERRIDETRTESAGRSYNIEYVADRN
ncbi:hypothetical protein GGS21DRAFT_486156 [Xylaria nigripes]|nr:hypothetical protein GGS21DRAFT_486156 [Xylaria nigripes]